jgi:DNA-binding CsgD family transcriptional regulator
VTQILICQDDGTLTVLTDPRPAPALAALIQLAGEAAARAAGESGAATEVSAGGHAAAAAAAVIAYTQPLLAAGAPWMAMPLGEVVLVFHPARVGVVETMRMGEDGPGRMGASPTPTLAPQALGAGETNRAGADGATRVGASPTPTPMISPRQRQVLALMAEGHGDGQIARRLGVSMRTVRAYTAGLRERLGAANREQLLARAVALGLVRPSLEG